MWRVSLNGFLTGLLLQAAVGPVFFYVVNRVLQKTFLDGIVSAFAVTLADYLYIILAIAGIGKLLEKQRIKKILKIAGSIVLIVFGVLIVVHAMKMPNSGAIAVEKSSNIISSFTAAFILTISNPLTILFWTGLFAAKSIEYGYSRKELIIFGLSAGASTFLFLVSAAGLLTLIKSSVPEIVVIILNLSVGAVLLLYGIIRLVSTRSGGQNEKNTRS